jgi:hypothetical protein
MALVKEGEDRRQISTAHERVDPRQTFPLQCRSDAGPLLGLFAKDAPCELNFVGIEAGRLLGHQTKSLAPALG